MTRSQDRAWATAYLSQAQEDLDAATKLGSETPGTLAMLLQMVFEKAAKAAMLRMGTLSLDKARTTHIIASKLIATLKRDVEMRKMLGAGNAHAWNAILPIINELESAHPQIVRDQGPQLEYPWEDAASGKVQWPAKDLPIAQRFRDPRSRELTDTIRFAIVLLQKFDVAFPE